MDSWIPVCLLSFPHVLLVHMCCEWLCSYLLSFLIQWDCIPLKSTLSSLLVLDVSVFSMELLFVSWLLTLFCIPLAKGTGRIDEGLKSSASFIGGSGLSCLFLDFIECQTSLDLIWSVFCLCWDTCGCVIFLPPLRYYGGCSGLKNIFNIFSLLSPYPLLFPISCGTG